MAMGGRARKGSGGNQATGDHRPSTWILRSNKRAGNPMRCQSDWARRYNHAGRQTDRLRKQIPHRYRDAIRPDRKGNARHRIRSGKVPSIHVRKARQSSERPQAARVNHHQAALMCTPPTAGDDDAYSEIQHRGCLPARTGHAYRRHAVESVPPSGS